MAILGWCFSTEHCHVPIYLYVHWDRQEGHISDGHNQADYPVYRVPCLCHVMVLEREGTATPPVQGNLQPELEKNTAESKDFSRFNSQEDAFLMRRDKDIQQLVDLLKMAVCSGNEELQKI